MNPRAAIGHMLAYFRITESSRTPVVRWYEGVTMKNLELSTMKRSDNQKRGRLRSGRCTTDHIFIIEAPIHRMSLT